MRNLIISLLFCTSPCALAQGDVARGHELPLKIPPYLSGNFGELRSNHFHSGIDFKTQGVTGKPVYSFDDGWVSRIAVSPWGYGHALYISHYNGMTTVYAHLEAFSPAIAKIVKDYQYETETFTFDKHFGKGEIPVKKGELIAKSGNTGSSGGPHVHFEIRDTESEEPIDPLPFFMDKIKDTRKPELRSVRVYPLGGVVNGSNSPVTASLVKKEDGSVALDKTFTAWGKIGLGVKAYDRMDETANIYGVKNIRLYVNDTLWFSFRANRFSFDKTRYLNSLTDYADWKKNKSMVMKLFVEPGNQLEEVYGQMIDKGVVDIREEKIYRLRYELADAYGNKTTFKFNINGKRQALPEPDLSGENHFAWNRENRFEAPGFLMTFPRGAFYTDIDFNYKATPSPKWHSDIHQIHENTTPLHLRCPVSIAINNDTVGDKSQYYLGTLRDGKASFVNARYESGRMQSEIRDFGTYVVAKDDTPPVILPQAPDNWAKNRKITFKISDGHSGIREWRGTIDDRFALFEYDGKTATLTYRMDAERIGKEKKHKLELTVTDNCGNRKTYERSFYW